MKLTQKQKDIFEFLQKSSSIDFYEKQGIDDKYILKFINENKKRNINVSIIQNNLNERLNYYKSFLDNLRNATFKTLCEETGVPNCIHYINDTIITYLKNYIRNNRQNIYEGEVFRVQLPENIFDIKKVFFCDCKIVFEMNLYISKYPLQTTDQLTSEYKDVDAVLKYFNIEGKQIQKLVNGEFILRVCEFEGEWEEAASKVIYHEFLHAYQDYNMLLSNQDYKNGKNYLATKILYSFSNDTLNDIVKNQEKYRNLYGKYTDLVINCCNAVYVLTKMEQNAYISQAYEEIKDFLFRKKSSFTYEEIIENTTIYDLMYNLSIFLEELKKIDEEGIVYVGMTMASLKRGKVNSEDECAKEYRELILRIERVINRVYNKLTRLIGNYCTKNNYFGSHGKMTDLYKRMINK